MEDDDGTLEGVLVVVTVVKLILEVGDAEVDSGVRVEPATTLQKLFKIMGKQKHIAFIVFCGEQNLGQNLVKSF